MRRDGSAAVRVPIPWTAVAGNMRLMDGDPPIIRTLDDVAFWWGWAEHFEALAEQYQDSHPELANGLRNKAGVIVKALEDYKRRMQ